MTTTTKSIIAIVGAVLVAWAIYGAYQYPEQSTSVIAGTSAAGSNFSTAKFAGIAANLANPGSTGTSSSILNGDANDRYITSIKAGCESVGTSKTAYTGAGLLALTLSVATTSTSAPATNGTNTIGGGSITLATSTTQFVVASTTSAMPGNTNISLIWPSGSYLTFSTNATNTAVCTFGADYVAS